METIIALLIFCMAPFGLVLFGYWLGRGAPGWPWAMVRRAGSGGAGASSPYYEEEELYG